MKFSFKQIFYKNTDSPVFSVYDFYQYLYVS